MAYPSSLRRDLPVALAACWGAALSFVLFAEMRGRERDRVRAEFERLAGARATVLQHSLDDGLEALDSFRAFYGALGEANGDPVREFVHSRLSSCPGLNAVAWVERVPGSEREAWEEKARKTIVPGFQITERDENGAARRASSRAEHFPVVFIEPFGGHEAEFGLDLGFDPTWRMVLEGARASGEVVASEGPPLPATPEGEPEVLVFSPVSGSGRLEGDASDPGGDLQGFAMGILRLRSLFEDSLKILGAAGIEFRLQVKGGAENGRLVCAYPAPAEGSSVGSGKGAGPENREGPRWRATLQFAGREWFLLCLASPAFLATHAGGSAWGGLAVGLLLTALLTAYLSKVSGGSAQLERGARGRLAELAAANKQLKREIAEKMRAAAEARDQATADLHRARELADDATRADREFRVRMSHELGTELDRMLATLDQALKSSLAAEPLAHVEGARERARFVLGLLERLVPKGDADQPDPEAVRFDLRSLMEEVADLFAPAAQRKGVEFICGIESDVPRRLRGNSAGLREILVQLVNNAVGFTEHGEVSLLVETAASDDSHATLRLIVKDTGPGIPGEKLKGLFEPTASGDGSAASPPEKAGSGLVLAQRLAEKMGGKIEVRSEVGSGSTFTATLVFDKVADPEPLDPPAPAEFDGLRVLVVDDNGTHRALLRKKVEALGCSAEAAESGDQALARMRAAAEEGKPFSVALVDFGMPEKNGLEVASAVRSAPELNPTAVVVLAPLDLPKEVAEAQASGLVEVLPKPVKDSELLEVLPSCVASGEAKPAGSQEAPTPASS